MRAFALLGLLLPLWILTGCQEEEVVSTEIKDAPAAVKKSPVFTLTDLQKNTYEVEKHKTGLHFKSMEDKIILANFFATWCPPCRAEIPHLNSLEEKYGKDFKVVGIMMDKNLADSDAEEFVKEHDVRFTVAKSEANFALADALGGVGSIPYMILYDKEGNYFTHYVGAVPEEMIATDIKRAMGTE